MVIDTDPLISTEAGGHWWDVAVPEVSARKEVNAARKAYEESGEAAARRATEAGARPAHDPIATGVTT